MTEQRLKYLLFAYLGKNITGEEAEELDEYLSRHPKFKNLLERMRDSSALSNDLVQWEGIDADSGLQKTMDAIHTKADSKRRIPLRRTIIAAAVTLLLAGGAYYMWNQRHSEPDIPGMPGTYKATLTLADGSNLQLEQQPNGLLPQHDGTKVVKLDSATLSYQGQAQVAGQYNTLTIPRAGQFMLILPDGTRVWLNNSSRLHYPTSFTGTTREVELTGEAYFEVAADPIHPFLVKTSDFQIDVLGTSFNVTSWPDQEEGEAHATLMTGKIRLTNENHQYTLQPGQQATLDRRSKDVQIHDVDTDNDLAWKDGYFHFSHTDLQTMLRQFSRWYDVDVKIEGPLKPQSFAAEFNRNSPLTDILKALENKDAHFTLNGRELIVSR
jgi:transmembrane sensor